MVSAAVAGVGVEGGIDVCCWDCRWFSVDVEDARREPEIIEFVRAT